MPTLGVVLTIVATALGATAAGHALLKKRRPQAALGWIAISIMVPFVGAVLYYLFGINRVESRARLLRGTWPAKATTAPAPPLTGGNHVDALHNGEQAYPAMLAAIRAARERVWLSTYIFGTAGVGGELVDALAEAARRGVDVRVLLDGVGELYSWPRAGPRLQRAGVRLARFLPPRILPPAVRLNLRNHRKVLIVDSEIAFTGGMNLDARHMVGDPARSRRVVDLHFRLLGPVVRELEAVFAADWSFATREPLAAPEQATQPRHAGNALCRVVPDGPDENRDPLSALLLEAVASARRRVAILTPYFLPPPELVGVLQSAALRGVDVAVVLPAQNNLPYVHWATRHSLWQLLLHEVRVYLQPGPFVHSKLLLIDDDRAVVGSWNLDPRSLRLNFELAVDIRDARLTGELSEHFHACRTRSREVVLQDVDGRPLLERLRDGAAWLFSPYL